MGDKVRTWKGNMKRLGDEWTRAGVVHTEETDWFVYTRTNEGTDWINVRVLSPVPVEHKANYHLAWNGERFSRCHDQTKLETYRPELHKLLEDFLSRDEA